MNGRQFEPSNQNLYCPTNYVDHDTPRVYQQGQCPTIMLTIHLVCTEWRTVCIMNVWLRCRDNFVPTITLEDAKFVRENIRDYFNSPLGQVTW